jgi:hypothetical protein
VNVALAGKKKTPFFQNFPNVTVPDPKYRRSHTPGRASAFTFFAAKISPKSYDF